MSPLKYLAGQHDADSERGTVAAVARIIVILLMEASLIRRSLLVVSKIGLRSGKMGSRETSPFSLTLVCFSCSSFLRLRKKEDLQR